MIIAKCSICNEHFEIETHNGDIINVKHVVTEVALDDTSVVGDKPASEMLAEHVIVCPPCKQHVKDRGKNA